MWRYCSAHFPTPQSHGSPHVRGKPVLYLSVEFSGLPGQCAQFYKEHTKTLVFPSFIAQIFVVVFFFFFSCLLCQKNNMAACLDCTGTLMNGIYVPCNMTPWICHQNEAHSSLSITPCSILQIHLRAGLPSLCVIEQHYSSSSSQEQGFPSQPLAVALSAMIHALIDMKQSPL